MVRHDINIDVARETVYELVGPELEAERGRGEDEGEAAHGCNWLELVRTRFKVSGRSKTVNVKIKGQKYVPVYGMR